MPSPSDLAQLSTVIRQSGLVEDDVLERYISSPVADAACPTAVLDRMVRDDVLTHFQAAQLAQGRWRGFIVGPYRLLDRIGAGGMGRVYRAAKPGGVSVAVKVLDSRLMGDETAMRRFVREARTAAGLDHPNVVRILDMDLTARPPYLVMEYVNGPTFQAAVARGGRFAPGVAADCGRQACLGLQATANARLVHRDVKPANLAVTRTGTVKLLDLGIVRTADGDPLTAGSVSRVVLGTVDYLAPEQAVNSSDVDIRADVYSLGATLYFLLAGYPPFPDGTNEDKLSRKQSADPPPLHTLRADLSSRLSDVVGRMMARRPADRFRDPSEAAAALAPWASDIGPLAAALAGGGPEVESDSTLDGELRGRAAGDDEMTDAPPTLPAGIHLILPPPDSV